MRLSILAALLTRGSAHYTQTSFSPPVVCSDGPRYNADLLASCQTVGEGLTCHLPCAKAFTALGDYAALCEPAVASDASFRRVAGVCSRLEPWRINGAPLTVLPCGAATDAPDGVDAHLAEVRAACGPLQPGGTVCPDTCREPFTVLGAYYDACGVRPPAEHEAARKAGCTPLQPALHEPCACAAAAANWSITCYNEEAMDAAAAILRGSGCDEVSDGVPRCAVEGSRCYAAFQLVQAHHDYCHAADIPQAASDAFHEYVGSCSECHVLRDRLPRMPDCKPIASCADTAPADAAFAALKALDMVGSSCHTLPGGELVECGEHYRVLQAYHDGCEGIERTSTAVRDGFHTYAARCERSGCNSLSRYSDPNSQAGCAPRRSGARGSGGGGGDGDGGSGWLYALGLLLGLGSLFAWQLGHVKQWRARWRGSPRERHFRRALPCIVVVTVFIIGVAIGNGGGGGSFAWGLLTSYPLAGLLFIAARLYRAHAAGRPLDGALRNILAEATDAVSTERSTARLAPMASTDQTIASPTFTPMATPIASPWQPSAPAVLTPGTNDVDLRATVDLSPAPRNLPVATAVVVGTAETPDMD